MAARVPRVLVDNSHEFLFRAPFFHFCQQQLKWQVCDTRIGLRPEIVMGFDLVVVYSGHLPYLEWEMDVLSAFKGGLVVVRSHRQFAQDLLVRLGDRPNTLVVPCDSSDEYCAQFGDTEAVKEQLETLAACRVGDDGVFAQLDGVEAKRLTGSGFFIRHPDSLDEARAARLMSMVSETYEMVSREFGYKHDEQPLDITALPCIGAGYQASKYIVGIGCLGEERNVRSVLCHEFSNSLCYELAAMGGDAGWSSYVQDKVKRALGWHSKTTQQIHDENAETVQRFERNNNIVIDPSSEEFYSSGVRDCKGALIAKWKALYASYELEHGQHFMHRYFSNAKRFRTQLEAHGWSRVHDRMIVYMSLATGRDETDKFRSSGFKPTRCLADDLASLEGVTYLSSCGCEGPDRPQHLATPWYAAFLPLCEEGLCYDDGVQVFTAPSDGAHFDVELAGASGGQGGRGAVLRLSTVLHAGDQLRFLIGQRPSRCNGGGGASVCWLVRGGVSEMVAIAGGGGSQDASLTEDGIDSQTKDGIVVPSSGGRGGQGGKGQNGQGGQGGAGWLGGSRTWEDAANLDGPKALSDSPAPGYRYNPQLKEDSYGGLGGGGAEWYASGGGGGYSGGGGAECYGRSGGGGSYLAAHFGVREIEPRSAANQGAGYAKLKRRM